MRKHQKHPDLRDRPCRTWVVLSAVYPSRRVSWCHHAGWFRLLSPSPSLRPCVCWPGCIFGSPAAPALWWARFPKLEKQESSNYRGKLTIFLKKRKIFHTMEIQRQTTGFGRQRKLMLNDAVKFLPSQFQIIPSADCFVDSKLLKAKQFCFFSQST